MTAATSTEVDASEWQRHVIVVGLDGVGLRTVEQLHHAGVRVVAVDPHPDARRAQAIAGLHVPLLTGSPRLPQTLHDAGLWGAQAVLCVEGEDLACLETALLVRELRPDVRVACRLANSAVGEAVGGLGITVLDVAALAAPAVVEACLRRRDHPLAIGDRAFVAATVRAETPGTLRELYGDLAPLIVAPADGSATLVCPGRDEQVRVGDDVTLLGTLDELVAAGLREPEGVRNLRIRTGRAGTTIVTTRAAKRRWVRARRWWRTGWSSFVTITDRGVRIAIAAILLLVVVSTIVLKLSYRDDGHHLTLAQSVYFTVETIATVGFGDFSFAREGTGLQIFGIALIGLGTGLVSTLFALLTNALVTRRVEQSLGRTNAGAMRDHVVLVGLGSVGVRVLDRLLDEGRQVVVVEADEDNRFLAHARARHVPVVQADATQTSTLRAVQVGRAAAVALMTSNDLINIETALAVRTELDERWSSVPCAVRVFERPLAAMLEQSFDFHYVRSTSAIAAPFFVSAALGLDLLGGFEASGQVLLLGRLHVAEGGGLDGLEMRELAARTRVVALGRADGSIEYPPRRGTRFAGGDVAYLIGPYDEILSVLRRDQADVPVIDQT